MAIHHFQRGFLLLLIRPVSQMHLNIVIVLHYVTYITVYEVLDI